VDLHKSPGVNTVFRAAHKFTLAPNATAFRLTLTALPGATLGPTISGLELYSVLPVNNQTLAATSKPGAYSPVPADALCSCSVERTLLLCFCGPCGVPPLRPNLSCPLLV